VKVKILSGEDITLGVYVDYTTELSPIKKVSICSNLQPGDVRKLHHSVIETVLTEFDKEIEEVEATFQPRFEMDGVKYGLHPNIEQISTGEFIDLEACAKNWIQKLPRVIAILYRPVVTWLGDKYSITPYDQYDLDKAEQTMRNTPLSIASGALVFFCNLSNDLTMTLEKNQRTTLQKIVTEMKQEVLS
jgi:hypothetical protein